LPAERKIEPLSEIKRWLSTSLAYEPDYPYTTGSAGF
jgi:hypothetical protein